MINITAPLVSADKNGWEYTVEVTEDEGKTQHTVTLSKDYYQKLTKDKKVLPVDLIEKSFEFLLEKESKESILKSFDLTKISEYFSDYEKEIITRL